MGGGMDDTPRIRPASDHKAAFALNDLKAHLTEFALSYRSAHLPPVAPPPPSPSLSKTLTLWLYLACTPVAYDPRDSPPPSKKRKLDFEQEASCPHTQPTPYAWPSHIRNSLANTPDLQAPVEPEWSEPLLIEVSKNSQTHLRLNWAQLQIYLGVLLIRRLCERFAAHVNKHLSEEAPWEEKYKKDCEHFLAQRRFLVFVLRAYPFAPFTLPRLADLLRKRVSASTWGNSFEKWCYAVSRTLRGVLSELPAAAGVSELEPEDKDVIAEIKRGAYVRDTFPRRSDFIPYDHIMTQMTSESGAETPATPPSAEEPTLEETLNFQTPTH